jgi:hypothetical protein
MTTNIHKVCVSARTNEVIELTEAEETAYTAAETPVSETDKVSAKATLSGTDVQMARVTEDLIDILIANGTIELSDFPQASQDVIAERVALRDDIAG